MGLKGIMIDRESKGKPGKGRCLLCGKDRRDCRCSAGPLMDGGLTQAERKGDGKVTHCPECKYPVPYCRCHHKPQKSDSAAPTQSTWHGNLWDHATKAITGGTSGTSGTSGAPLMSDRRSCDHTGKDPCLTLSDGKRLYGARVGQLTDVRHLDLIIDCTGTFRAKPFVRGSSNRKFRALGTLAYPDVLTLDWPDMTAPGHVGIRFWQRLRDLLPPETVVCCIGSHGRTGTALACLLVADGMDPDEAITTVRAKHCERAIETAAQLAYIRGLK